MQQKQAVLVVIFKLYIDSVDMYTYCKGRMLLALLSVRSGLSNLTSETIYNYLERPSLILLRRCIHIYLYLCHP